VDQSTFLESLLSKAPICLALFAAAVFMMARTERHPLPSLLSAIGFGWMLVVTVVDATWRIFAVPELFPEPDGIVELLSYAVFSVLQSLGIACIVVAIVIGRQPRRRPDPSDADDDYDDHRRP
jgi:hypothetical protein